MTVLRLPLYIFIHLALITHISFAQSSNKEHLQQAHTSNVSVIRSVKFPESITSDGRYYYISSGVPPRSDPSNSLSAPTHKKSHQYAKIAKFKHDGTLVNSNFAPRGDSVESVGGLVISGQNIYASDTNRVLAMNVQTGKVRFSMSFEAEGTHALSGITAKNEKELFVTASDTHQIFHINLEKMTYSPLRLSQKLYSPKGIVYDQQRQALFVTEFGTATHQGRLLRIKPSRYKVSKVQNLSTAKAYLGKFDAISQVGNYLFFSDWSANSKNGKIHQYDLNKGSMNTLTIRPLHGPSDILLDNTGRWWISATLDHFVLVKPAISITPKSTSKNTSYQPQAHDDTPL